MYLRDVETKIGKGAGRGAGVFVAAALAAGAMALFFVYRARSAAALNEDAFISFRYARNFLAGEGLVFNTSAERVEGITNLLWTLLIAAASGLSGVSLPDVATSLGIFFGAATVGVAFAWCYGEVSEACRRRPLAVCGGVAAAALLCLAPGFAFYSASGLEIAFFALLLTGGLFALCRGVSWGAVAAGSVLLGLAAITRPEGVLALFIGALACALVPKAAPLSERFARLLAAGLPGAAIVGAVTVWRLYYYGSHLPNTAYAKAGGMEVVERWGIPYLIEAAQGSWFILAWLVALAGAALDRSFSRRALAGLAIVPVWCAYVVYVGGDYMEFHRLLVPLLPVVFVLAVAGFSRLLAALPEDAVGYSASRRALVSMILAAAFAFPLLAGLPDQLEREQTRQEERQRDNERRQEIAAWFRENDPNAVLARNGVGVVGYYTEIEIVDMLGLNDEHIARHGDKHPRAIPGHQSSDAEYVLAREPDYIMPADTWPDSAFPGDRELTELPQLQENYELVELEVESGRDVAMFRRK